MKVHLRPHAGPVQGQVGSKGDSSYTADPLFKMWRSVL